LDIAEIKKLLPHRFPFLLVDRVVEVQSGQSLRAYKNVSANEAFFEGHFPGHPVMPGVLMIEALAQAAALLALKSMDVTGGQAIYLVAIDNARFRRPVVPGDRLDLEVSVEKRRARVWRMHGKASVDGQPCCEADLMATVPNDMELPSAREPPGSPGSVDR
jgi:3-hydroxyacyl-[acyl-carrier-protein] dehydratase